MDKQSTFETFIEHRTQSLLERLEEAKHEFSSESIRRLRVGIKRWRTIYRLVTMLQPQSIKSSKLERSVKRLFKRAGIVRSNQLNRQLIGGLGLPVALEKSVGRFFKKQEKKARKRLKKATKAFRVKQLRKTGRVISYPHVAVSPLRMTHHLGRLMDHEAGAIADMSLAEISTEELHTIRKHLKALIEMGQVTLSITPDKSLTHVMQRAITLQRRMGNWHDQMGLFEQLNDYIARHPSGASPEKIRVLYKRLDNRIQRQTTRIRQEVAKISQWLPLMTPWLNTQPT